MTFLILLLIYTAIVGLLFYVLRRSAGLPILAMVAGSFMANLWSDFLTGVIASFGISIAVPPLSSLVFLAIVFVPVLLVLPQSNRVNTKSDKILATAFFTLLVVTLTYRVFTDIVKIDLASQEIVNKLLPYSSLAITACIIFALVSLATKRSE